jgi:excisionase family DNA binding protein
MNRGRHEEKGMPSDIKFLTIEDLAEMLQVTRTTIYNLKNKGLPFIKLGRNIRFDQDEVIEWIKNGQEASSQESK